MDRAIADNLAYALIDAMVWAVRGADMRTFPRVHQELSDALCGAPQQAAEIGAVHHDLIKQAQQRIFDTALSFSNGHPSAAARLLGVSRATMYRHTHDRKRATHAESPAPSDARESP